MSWILVLFVVVQILFHSSLSALLVEASRSWCGIKKSAFSFPSIPWCDGIQVIIIRLWSLVSFLNHLYDFVLFNRIDVCYRVYRRNLCRLPLIDHLDNFPSCES